MAVTTSTAFEFAGKPRRGIAAAMPFSASFAAHRAAHGAIAVDTGFSLT